jgi:hypothetical protein
MARIRCHYLECKFLDELYCVAASVHIDPDAGCQTFEPIDEKVDVDDQIDADELDDELDDDEWEDIEDGEEADDFEFDEE